MNELRTEEEQVEALKKWWDENGKTLLLSVVVVAGGWFGWNSYQDNIRNTGEAASAVYAELVELSALPVAQQTDEVKTDIQALIERLTSEFSSTNYANIARLFEARMAADAGDFDAAAEALKTAIATADDGAVKYTAQARLANVLIQLEQFDAALAQVAVVPDPAYLPQFAEARGDAYFRKGDHGAAVTAYTEARDAAQGAGTNTQLLQRKIDSLASTGDL